jgi:hypothetical protein
LPDSLLLHAFVDEQCHACGDSYRVTLHELLMEHRLHDEWVSPRPCGNCSAKTRPLMRAMPAPLLEALYAAWERLVEAAEANEVPLQTG